MTVAWHQSIDPGFDPVAVLNDVARSRGLVVKERLGKGRTILRIDTAESSPEGRKSTNKLLKQTLADLWRDAASDPKLAAALRQLAERHKNGEDVKRELITTIDRQVTTSKQSPGSTRYRQGP